MIVVPLDCLEAAVKASGDGDWVFMKMLALIDGRVIRSRTLRCSGATITLSILEDHFPITQNKHHSKDNLDPEKYIKLRTFHISFK